MTEHPFAVIALVPLAVTNSTSPTQLSNLIVKLQKVVKGKKYSLVKKKMALIC